MWTEAKNQRRCRLIDKGIDGTLSPDEKAELDRLQAEMFAHRQRVAPLPLGRLRAWYRRLSHS